GLEHFRKGKLHLVAECREMRRGNLVIFVLDQMQIFDQEVTAPWPVAEQKFNFLRSRWIDLTPLGRRLCPLAPLARVFERADLLHVMTHRIPIPSNFDGFYSLACQMPIGKYVRYPNDLRASIVRPHVAVAPAFWIRNTIRCSARSLISTLSPVSRIRLGISITERGSGQWPSR